jgi:GGDEF domain-containing protein
LLPASPAREPGARFPLRRLLAWAALAGAIFATLAVAAGVALRDRPMSFVALVVATTIVVVSLLSQGLATRILAQLDAAATERARLEAELAAAHEAQAELRNLAYHDDLTGLPNRSLLYDRLGLAIAHAEREGSHLAVLFVDLDGFTAVNDSFGHGFGDRFLVELALRLRASVRAGDTVARFGGDEFVVLLDSVTGAADAALVAARSKRRRGPVPTRRPRGLDRGECRSQRVSGRRHLSR